MLDSADADATMETLLAAVDAERLPAGKPADIRAACEATGWKARIDWHPVSDGDLIVTAFASGRPVPKAVLSDRIGAITGAPCDDVAERPIGRSGRPFTSRPLERRRAMRLIQRLKSELQSRLPSYMVPSAFVLVDHLPLTIQGKLDRAKLPPPPTMRMASATEVRGASTPTERALVEIWEELLEVAPIGVDDDFFDLGGHSMLAVRMVSLVQQHTGLTLPLAALFRKPTIAELADLLDDPVAGESPLIVPLAIGGDGEPLFCVHPAGGTVFCYRDLANRLAGSRPVFGVQARGLDGRDQPHQTLDEMAEDYALAIREVAPTGPIHLIGWSLGGNIAYEVARRITDGGRHVGSLALLDAGLLAAQGEMSEEDFLPLVAALFPGQQHQSLEELRQKSAGEQLAYFIDQAAKAGIVPDDPSLVGPHIFDVFQANIKAVHDYQPRAYSGNLLLIRPGDQVRTSTLFDDQCLGWRPMVRRVELATVSGDHAHMLQSPAVDEIVRHWTDYVQQSSPSANTVPLCDSGDSRGVDQESIRC
jgi:thioesterase domain-containing protein/acyl carrier protein